MDLLALIFACAFTLCSFEIHQYIYIFFGGNQKFGLTRHGSIGSWILIILAKYAIISRIITHVAIISQTIQPILFYHL